jgi:hypothetical protein
LGLHFYGLSARFCRFRNLDGGDVVEEFIALLLIF